MTTQNTQPENDDTQVTVVEESFASHSPATSDSTELVPSAQEHDAAPGPGRPQGSPLPGIEVPEMTGETTASGPSFVVEEAVRPFTSFIEEFRQAEERLGVSVQETQGQQAEPARATQASPPPIHTASRDEGEKEEQEPTRATQASPPPIHTTPAPTDEEETRVITGALNRAPTPAERPVSPLLRPPTRIRMPRHGGGRQRETFATQNPARAIEASPAVQATAGIDEPAKTEVTAESVRSGVSTPEADQMEQQEQPRPARRYRFDRPIPLPQQPTAPTITPAKSAPGASSPPSPVTARAENAQTSEWESRTTEQQSSRPAASPGSPAATTENEGSPAAPSVQTQDHRRRHGQERQRAKTQPANKEDASELKRAPLSVPTAVPVTAVVEEAAPAAEPEVPAASEIAVEDLPPLEYSELQAASSRRRRRRRANGSAQDAINRVPTATPTKPATSEQPAAAAPSPASPLTPTTTPARGVAVPASPYTIQSGYTISQMNQGNDLKGPFMGPEPSPARGSISSTPSRMVRSIRNGNEAQRTPTYPAVRPGEPVVSPGSINHLANVITQAIQTQSDRMVAELRRANQAPTNVSVAFPPFPSTERVGVFVDVANLLYSARTLRMTIDFGKLLDFLRGNRRLVRAHAYCPTSPQPGDDQMFLQAVKGLGYRITTKNYKTFASGAKKADMDLDLCMDVVRLVDGNAVDCIVLVSGDSDFMPMLDYCSDHGVRVEVAAFDESMSATLRQSCDLFVNLSMLEEIRV